MEQPQLDFRLVCGALRARHQSSEASAMAWWYLVVKHQTRWIEASNHMKFISMDWFKGKSTGNHGFYHQILGFPVNFPIIQFYDMKFIIKKSEI
jgi:hypothetical protein